MKKFTKEQYDVAIAIDKEFMVSDTRAQMLFSMDDPFQKYCEIKVKELSEPALKWYKCIKEIPACDIFKSDSSYLGDDVIKGFYVSELPFHFELIPEPVEIEPKRTWDEVQIREVFTEKSSLEDCGNDNYSVTYINDLMNGLKDLPI